MKNSTLHVVAAPDPMAEMDRLGDEISEDHRSVKRSLDHTRIIIRV